MRTKMKNLLCGLLAPVVLLCACTTTPAPDPSATAELEPTATTAPQPSTETQGTPVTFTDALGREVSVQPGPQRVATLIGSFADIWCLAGGQQSLVATADDTWTYFDLGLADDVVNLGAVKEPSAEKLLAAAPQLVIASANTAADIELLEVLEQAGLPVVYFSVSTFQDYLDMLKICTEITGCPENYKTYGTAVQGQIDAAKAPAAGHTPSVLYLRASASGIKVKDSHDSVLGEMLADFGCRNIADSDTGLLEELSMEAVLAAAPEKIFIVVQGADPTAAEALLQSEIYSNPAWQQLAAVQSNQVYTMDSTLYNLKPNERWGDAYEGLAQILCDES